MSTRLGQAKSARSNRKLLVDIERVERFLELLLDRIVGAFLEHIHLAVIGGIGAESGPVDSTCSSNSRALTMMKNACLREMVS